MPLCKELDPELHRREWRHNLDNHGLKSLQGSLTVLKNLFLPQYFFSWKIFFSCDSIERKLPREQKYCFPFKNSMLAYSLVYKNYLRHLAYFDWAEYLGNVCSNGNSKHLYWSNPIWRIRILIIYGLDKWDWNLFFMR